MDSAEEYGLNLSTLGLKERQTWDRQETFLAAYSDAGSIRKTAPAAQISREAVRVWQRDDVLGFKQRLEHAQHSFREMLQDKAIELVKELKAFVADQVGAFARPEFMQWAPGLPKTRSGKIMRRILRKIACNELDSLGDTSTLADPTVVQDLISNRIAHA